MCNSIKSTIVTWLILLSLFLSGCAAVQPAAVAIPRVTELTGAQAQEVIRLAGDVNQNMLRLYNPAMQSWAFARFNGAAYDVVVVVPAKSRELVSKLQFSDVSNLLQMLKAQGWEKVSPAVPWVATAIQMMAGVQADLLFMLYGGSDYIPFDNPAVIQ